MSERIARLIYEELASTLLQLLEPRCWRFGHSEKFSRCTDQQAHILAPFMMMTDVLKAALPDRRTGLGAKTGFDAYCGSAA